MGRPKVCGPVLIWFGLQRGADQMFVAGDKTEISQFRFFPNIDRPYGSA